MSRIDIFLCILVGILANTNISPLDPIYNEGEDYKAELTKL